MFTNKQETKMNIDPIISSTLHVTAKENIDISADLAAIENKTIAQLLESSSEKENEENTKQE